MAASVFGGTAPFVAVALNRGTRNSLRFALYLIVFAVVTLVIALVKGRTWVADSEEHSGDIQRRYAHPGGQPVDDLTLLRDFDRSNRKSRQSP